MTAGKHRWNRLSMLLCAIASLLIVMCASGGAMAANNPIADGWYMIVSGNSDDRVLDINNWSQANGGNLETYQKNNTTNQRFYLQYRNNGYYSIMVLHSGKYLHKANSGKKDDVHQWAGYGADNTQWALEDAGNGYYYIRSKSGNYMDNSGGSTELGNNVITYKFNGSAAQKWKFLSTSDAKDEKQSVKNGWYMIQSGNSDSRVLDINNWSQANGGNLETYQKNNTTNQRFYLQYRGNGYYSIMALHSSKYLHKANSGKTEDVHQWAGYGADNTQWALQAAGSGYYYIRSKSGNYLDNSGGSTKLGNNVITYQFNGSNAQKWKFIPTSSVITPTPTPTRKPTPTPKPNSTLKIASGNYNPGTLTVGDAYYTSGKITSNYKITSVTVGIYQSNGTTGVYVKTASPNSTSYDIKNLDNDMKFGALSAGSYVFKVMAKDSSGANKTLVNKGFTVKNPIIISAASISSAASTYSISTNTNAYKALQSINNYAPRLSASERKGTLVFLFEGVGSDSSASLRMNAMCVVVKSGDIVYINRNSSTIPDYPFTPSLNEGTPMPTLKSGVYSFSTTNHRDSYAALHVNGAKVVRFKSKKNYYSSTSDAINVHRRSRNTIPPQKEGWVNSAGCQIIGKTGTGKNSEYAKFIKAVGIVGNSATGDSKFTTSVSGKIIIDRSYARQYLLNIGYNNEAIIMIG